MPAHVKIGAAWQEVQQPWVKIGASWQACTAAYVKVGDGWEQVWPSGVTPPGDTVYNATSSSVGSSTTGWALFNPAGQGSATAVYAQMPWKTGTAYTWTLYTYSPTGSSTSKSKLAEYDDRTINHSFTSTMLGEFNAGRDGFYFTKPAGVGWSTEINTPKLRVVTS